MRRIILGLALGAFLVSTAATPTFAQDTTKKGRINQRKENQQQRIGEGVENGSLTAGEAARLEGKEARLNKEIRHDRKDGGGLTPKERAKIERQQDRVSKDIYRQKHDKQKQ